MPFNNTASTRRGLTQYIVRYRESGAWRVQVFSKRNCGSDTNAQKKAISFWQFIRNQPNVDLTLRTQILQN